jgi:hypothetical protein
MYFHSFQKSAGAGAIEHAQLSPVNILTGVNAGGPKSIPVAYMSYLEKSLEGVFVRAAKH